MARVIVVSLPASATNSAASSAARHAMTRHSATRAVLVLVLVCQWSAPVVHRSRLVVLGGLVLGGPVLGGPVLGGLGVVLPAGVRAHVPGRARVPERGRPG